MRTKFIDCDTLEVIDSKGRSFFISPQDEELVQRYTWYVSNRGYVERKDWAKGRNITRRLHRAIIINAEMVDHINGDRTDNRRINLRACTRSQNAMNTKIPSDNKFGYKGIIRRMEQNYKDRDVFRVVIQIDKKRINVGTYFNLAEAADARIAVEKKYYGEYRREYANE